MIEITYADMFLIIVILTLLGLWLKDRLELVKTKVVALTIFEDLHSGKAELYHDGEQVMVRKVSNNV
jgi:hypothetical protein